MRNTIIVTVLLFIAVIAASIYYFSDNSNKQKNATKPLQYLPADTYFIATFKNNQATDTIFQNFELFEAIQGKQNFEDLKKIKQDFLRSKALEENVYDEEIILSYHPGQAGIATLYTIALHEKLNNQELATLFHSIDKKYKLNQTDTLDHTIYSFDQGAKDSILYCTLHENILFASYERSLIHQVIDKKVPKLATKQIEFFVNHNSKNTPLSLYFNNNQIAAFARKIMRSKFGVYLNQIDSLHGETAWNLNFKNDALIFKGETKLDLNQQTYLRLFANQSGQVQTLANFLPKNTASYINYSLSDINSFHSALHDLFVYRKEADKIASQQKMIENEGKVLFQKDILPLWNDEFAIAELDNEDLLGLVSLADTNKFLETAKKISSNQGDSIYQFDYSNILYTSFGDPFKTFQRPYFTRIGNVLFVANQTNILRKYRKAYEENQLLSGTAVFKNHSAIQSNRANITFYIEPETASNTIISNLKSEYAKDYRDKENFGYQNFYSTSFQLTGNQGGFVSGFFALYKTTNRLGGTAEWTFQMNSKLINNPWVFDQSDTCKFILVQEQDHTVYALNPSGKELWKTLFQGEIMGQPIQLPDRSILLNTRSRVYRFSPDGKMIPGFSLALENNASGGLTITNFNNEKRIYVPCSNQIAVYDFEGNKIKEWENPKLDSKILYDLKATTIANKHFIIAGTNAGSIYFFNENGHLYHQQDLDIDGQTLKNPIGLITTSDEKNSFVILAKGKGEIFKVPFEGIPTKVKVGDWSNSFTFNFEDVSGTADKDYVIISENKLMVYNQKDVTKYFEYKFVDDISNRPIFFKATNNNDLMAVGTDNRMIYIFNEDGFVRDGFPIDGLSKFYFGPINFGNNASYLISSKRDHKLYAYKF
ncbi:hypothetical protein LZQ00_00785 [Sphingobacterium sp. SRCM116780]|uniref:hypothetical protein n=1 Tax=Sphingobacterium sp. SRCM116780 TaxID=2907623 RepID=UPI001F225890|nr:hypothetical protein [Sphingobacterium sp. SRCM116780]UIR56378.1 hypothetical protein LZQ00_00785 [Sphingobacterium sp. SRCM116780]